MGSIQNVCRVCMADEENGKLLPVFQKNQKIAEELYFISGVKVSSYML